MEGAGHIRRRGRDQGLVEVAIDQANQSRFYSKISDERQSAEEFLRGGRWDDVFPQDAGQDPAACQR